LLNLTKKFPNFIFDTFKVNLLIFFCASLASTILTPLLRQLYLPLKGRNHTNTSFSIMFMVPAFQTTGIPEGTFGTRLFPLVGFFGGERVLEGGLGRG
jgi:hypothetical protein